MSPRPRLGVTLGDPNGVGPEVLVKALRDPSISQLARFTLYATARDLADVRAQLTAVLGAEAVAATLPGKAGAVLELAPLEDDGPRAPLTPGRFAADRAPAQVAGLERAADDALAGRIDGVVTVPVNKGIFQAPDGGAARWPGQSEMLAARTGADDWAMMLAGDRLRVVLATTHLPMERVSEALSLPLLLRRARVTLRFLRERFGIAQPRLAVAALNPHGGDGGMFGDEEQRMIAPAIVQLRQEDFDVSGPYPSDTLFTRYRAPRASTDDSLAMRRVWDAVLVMYHDQGLIPIKLLHFGEAVNVTIGLPIVRTSPDHGVAYDIAGTGQADPSGMKASIRLAARLAASPKPFGSTERATAPAG